MGRGFSLQHSFRNDYQIKISELQTFKDFFQKAYSSEEKIKLTIEKFSIACRRESGDERILNLVFAWEILLGEGLKYNIKGGMTNRLLNLIPNTRNNREMLSTKMPILYNARNAIVHGLDRKPVFECMNNLETYEEIIGTTITAFIDRMNFLELNYSEMIKKLDCDEADILDHEIDIGKLDWK
jgi:hypothetical protein